MNKTASANILGTEKIGTLLARFAIPGIISMVVNALYNIVDQVFIGQGVGYLGNGATNVIFPLTTLAMSFALLIGDGSASYFSLMLGKREEQEAAKGIASGIVGTLILGILLALSYLLFLPHLCRLFGATDAILPYALDYGRIIAIGIPFMCICAGVASIIRADGSPKFNMAGLLVGCLINIVCDPIFIFVFHWGVKGAAWATILGQFANAAMNLFYVSKLTKSVKLTREVYKGCLSYFPRIARLGISSFITQMAIVFIIAIQNNVLVTYGAVSRYGAEIPMTALGVTMKIFNILLSIVIGLTGGSQPILGFNYGSRQYDRVKQTYRYVTAISVAVMTIAVVLFQMFPYQIVSIFGTDSELYTEFAVRTLRIFLLLIPLGAVQITTGVFFQALGYPLQSSVLSLSKQIVFQIPLTIGLANILGVEGVLWAGPASEFLAFALAVLLLLKYWNRIFAAEEFPVSLQENTISDYTIAPKVSAPVSSPLIITISRSYGAGGRPVGKLLAQKLGIPYYDSELLVQTAEKTGIDKVYLESVDEKYASYLNGFTGVGGQRTPSNDITRLVQDAENALRDVIAGIANLGPCVIVGRRADLILKESHNPVRIFITMPLEERAQLIAKRDGISEKDARKTAIRIDKERADYYNALYDTKWGDAASYDLCLDLTSLGTEKAADFLMGYLKSIGRLA